LQRVLSTAHSGVSSSLRTNREYSYIMSSDHMITEWMFLEDTEGIRAGLRDRRKPSQLSPVKNIQRACESVKFFAGRQANCVSKENFTPSNSALNMIDRTRKFVIS
jgi:hypothetical protein